MVQNKAKQAWFTRDGEYIRRAGIFEMHVLPGIDDFLAWVVIPEDGDSHRLPIKQNLDSLEIAQEWIRSALAEVCSDALQSCES